MGKPIKCSDETPVPVESEQDREEYGAEEEESCDYGCAPVKAVRPQAMDDKSEGAKEAASEAAAIAGVEDAPFVARAEETAEEGGAASGAAEGEAEEGPTEEQLLEAIRGIPASLNSIAELTPKQVCMACLVRGCSHMCFLLYLLKRVEATVVTH